VVILLQRKTPNAESRASGISRHLSCGNQRFRMIREIATRDFNKSAPHLVNRRMPNPNGPRPFLCLWVNLLAASPRPNDQRDFATFLCDPWPLVLFSDNFSRYRAPFLQLELSPGSVPQSHDGTFPPELGFSRSFG
jgi:hypothetical protein